MFPTINLPATDVTALDSLLSFVKEHCTKLGVSTPVIIFDQSLHVKACKIASTTIIDIIFWLRGFHQLINFLLSVGYLMEGSVLRTPCSIEHMLQGHNGHWESLSSLQGALQKRYIQLWRSTSNIFFQRKSSKIYKYKTLMSVMLVITSFFHWWPSWEKLLNFT